MCKYKLKEPPIKKIPMGELRFEDIFSGEFLFHLNSTHGLWPEVVAHIFKDTEKQRRSLEKYLCKKKKS